ncbi:MAG: arylesterase [Alphaproteobacteria bacterium]|nr:MAG: arylesterase [Alphaproteobacteria bacterium]
MRVVLKFKNLGRFALLLCFWATSWSPVEADPEANGGPLILVVLGDSITAGYGLAEAEALPVKLEQKLRHDGFKITIRNAGISGDTTAGGRERIDWSVAQDVDAVLVALGGNDVLRAIPPEETEKNLKSIITQLRQRNIAVLLAGMLALPNYGPEFGEEFNGIYTRLAEEFDVPLYPFLLDGVATDPAYNQADGIHPNEAGVAIIVDRLGAFIASALSLKPATLDEFEVAP